jgi:hypothetical protein
MHSCQHCHACVQRQPLRHVLEGASPCTVDSLGQISSHEDVLRCLPPALQCPDMTCTDGCVQEQPMIS